MKNSYWILFAIFPLISCTEENNKTMSNANKAGKMESPMEKTTLIKTIDNNLPVVGILLFEGFLTNEVVAPLDVFAKHDAEGNKLYNVLLIAKENKIHVSEEGMKVMPDVSIDQSPELDVLVVPSSYHPEIQTADTVLVNFIKEQHKSTDYIASHCAGAFLIGASGIAKEKEIVTYVTGGEILQNDYPSLKVMDDAKVAVVEDGKFISSNGSLVSYIASLDLLEKMSGITHRKYVEEQLLLDRLVKR